MGSSGLKYILRIQEVYDEAVAHCRVSLQEIYLIRIKDEDVDIEPRFLPAEIDCFKTREMHENAVKKYLWLLKYVPDWFVIHQQIKIWHDNDDYCNDDELIKWYKGYQKRKSQKASIKEELLPINWHPSRYLDWCMSEDEKKRNRKSVGIKIGPFVSDDQIKSFFDLKRTINKDVFRVECF